MTKYILLALVLPLLFLALSSSQAPEVQAVSEPLLVTDGVDFPDSHTARVCVIMSKKLWSDPKKGAIFTLSGTVAYDDNQVEFSDIPVQDLELVTPVSDKSVYVVANVPLSPPPILPESGIACTQLRDKHGKVKADGGCQFFPCTL